METRIGQFFFKSRSYTPIPFLIAVLFFAAPTGMSLAAGFALMAAGEAVRLWSVGYTGFITRTRNVGAPLLVTSGPYARTRNPIYLGNFLLALGAVTAFNAFMPWTLLCFAGLFGFQYHFIIRLEEETLRRKFGGLYTRYWERVPRFLPSFKAYAEQSDVRFNAGVAFRNERNTYASMAFITVLALLMHRYGNPLSAWIKS